MVTRRPRVPLWVAAVLAVALGVLATIVSGEFRLSWAYLYFDVPFVALTAAGTAWLVRSRCPPPPGTLRGRPTTAHVREGQHRRGLPHRRDALELAERQQVSTNVQDVRRLRLDLQPWHDVRAVRELDEQQAAVGRT